MECLIRVFQAMRWLAHIGFEATQDPFDKLWGQAVPFTDAVAKQTGPSCLPVIINNKCPRCPNTGTCGCCMCGTCITEHIDAAAALKDSGTVIAARTSKGRAKAQPPRRPPPPIPAPLPQLQPRQAQALLPPPPVPALLNIQRRSKRVIKPPV